MMMTIIIIIIIINSQIYTASAYSATSLDHYTALTQQLTQS